MWNSFACDIFSFHNLLVPRNPITDSKTIYRDELNKNASRKKCAEKSGKDHFAYSKVPLIPKEDDGKDFVRGAGYGIGGSTTSTAEKKEVIRVKVRMTKQEAARMLSKCKDGGVLDFKDVALELVKIPTNQISIVSPGTFPVLESIPEEF
ncbi:hypothetical protein ACB098_01G140800 [Castanea mollissima]|uniref:DUF7890 domain-containing protein n=1 Tax=Castanea mollissima TaxID=60419 RepID=A0A8J4V9M4_9ROSI|nr:hypothetical protein CMV_030639 [Castanea mollissima]